MPAAAPPTPPAARAAPVAILAIENAASVPRTPIAGAKEETTIGAVAGVAVPIEATVIINAGIAIPIHPIAIIHAALPVAFIFTTFLARSPSI